MPASVTRHSRPYASLLPRCLSVAVKLEKYNLTVVQSSYDPASHQQRCRSESELQIGLSDVGASLLRIPSRRARSYTGARIRGHF